MAIQYQYDPHGPTANYVKREISSRDAEEMRSRKTGRPGCGKSTLCCHPERSEGSAFSQIPGKMQIPRAKSTLGMTKLKFFRSLRILFLAALFAASTLAGYSVHSQSQPLPPAPGVVVTPTTRAFALWGDIRFTDPADCDKSDPDARQAIVQEMTSVEPHPDFAVLTGDVVYHGHNNQDWDVFEKQTKPLRDAKIKIFPVLGNHDVDGGSGRPEFFKHFADLKGYSQLEKEAWYSITYGNSLFL